MDKGFEQMSEFVHARKTSPDQDDAVRANNFDLVRFAAAAFVVLGHSFSISGDANGISILGMGIHTLGVKIFFCLSGYLIAESWLRDPSLYRFLLKRVLRIFPALVVTIVISAAVLGPFFTSLSWKTYYSDPRFISYFDNIFLYITYQLPEVFETNALPFAVNGSLWTLPVEVFAYFCFANLLYSLSSIPRVLTLTAVMVLSIALDQVFRSRTDLRVIVYATDLGFAMQLVAFFAIGAFFSAEEMAKRIDVRHVTLVLLAMAAIPAGFIDTSWYTYLLIPFFCFAIGFSPKLSIFGDNDISYGMYLWAFPVGQCFYALGYGHSNGYVMAGLTLLALIPISFASWVFVERPCLRFKPNSIKK